MTAGPGAVAAIARAASRGPCGGREPGGRPGRALLAPFGTQPATPSPLGTTPPLAQVLEGPRSPLCFELGVCALGARRGMGRAGTGLSRGPGRGTETGSEGAGQLSLVRGQAPGRGRGPERRCRALRVNFPLQDGPEAAGWRAELGPAMGSPGLSSLPVPAGSVVRLSFPFAVVGGRQGSLVQPSFLLREPAGAAGPPVACASGATSGRRGAGQPGLCRVPPAARSLTVSLVFCLK